MTGAKADERPLLLDILTDPTVAGQRPGQTLIADKNYFGRDFEATPAQTGLHPRHLLRPARNASLHSPRQSGTTTESAHRSNDR